MANIYFQFALFAAVGAHAGFIAPLAPAAYPVALPEPEHAVDYYVSIRTVIKNVSSIQMV
jgi:hypothetical protein